MLTPSDIQQATDAIDALDTSGIRRVCMFCKRDLDGSNPNALRTTHGTCTPLCEPGLNLGWGKYQKTDAPIPTRENPLAPLFAKL